jgi:hypothetical protein
MRLFAATAALAVFTAGCTEFGFALRPDFVGVEAWTAVRPGQVNVEAKVGDVIHLPVQPLIGSTDPADAARTVSALRVTVNGVAIDRPEYHTSSTVISYVFRAEQAGSYRVEMRQPPGREPLRVWSIMVSP